MDNREKPFDILKREGLGLAKKGSELMKRRLAWTVDRSATLEADLVEGP